GGDLLFLGGLRVLFFGRRPTTAKNHIVTSCESLSLRQADANDAHGSSSRCGSGTVAAPRRMGGSIRPRRAAGKKNRPGCGRTETPVAAGVRGPGDDGIIIDETNGRKGERAPLYPMRLAGQQLTALCHRRRRPISAILRLLRVEPVAARKSAGAVSPVARPSQRSPPIGNRRSGSRSPSFYLCRGRFLRTIR